MSKVHLKVPAVSGWPKLKHLNLIQLPKDRGEAGDVLAAGFAEAFRGLALGKGGMESAFRTNFAAKGNENVKMFKRGNVNLHIV